MVFLPAIGEQSKVQDVSNNNHTGLHESIKAVFDPSAQQEKTFREREEPKTT